MNACNIDNEMAKTGLDTAYCLYLKKQNKTRETCFSICNIFLKAFINQLTLLSQPCFQPSRFSSKKFKGTMDRSSLV